MIHQDYDPNTAISEEHITCAICLKEFKSLGRHLNTHRVDTDEYKRVLGIPNDTPLMSKNAAKKAQDNMVAAREKSSRFQQGMMNKVVQEQQTNDQ